MKRFQLRLFVQRGAGEADSFHFTQLLFHLHAGALPFLSHNFISMTDENITKHKRKSQES